MKRFGFLAILISVFASLVLAENLLKVKVSETKVRKAKKFYAEAVETVRFGDSLKKLLQEEVWFKVKTRQGREGWIHESAVVTKSWRLPGDTGATGEAATVDEVALAGKGFNKDVEARYRRKHSQLNFDLVDKIERVRLAETEISKFLEEGGLAQ